MDRLSNNAFTPLGPGEDDLDHEALGGNTDPDLILWISPTAEADSAAGSTSQTASQW